ncbi:hypothetical protein [Rhodococcus sp. EPR-134]|uniref:hypothetical protein n=1 Tax=Rhodococcus sp. EPR-134 TaxID=1813675 RepID=UPI0007BBA0D1|nr:hypothetical protein [Rhodococcus sp. EPR-134]KZF17837.1 hypothetical protein A2J01_23300 [Rhodococcus sp. EPR-134]
MTPDGQGGRAVSDPVGLIADLVAAVEKDMNPGQIYTVVTSVAGGRAKSRRLAAALVERPEVLADGRSPAPRAVGDLLIALRKAGASAVSPPCCAECGKGLRTFQRRGQDWYCAVCEQPTEPCTACGNTRPVSSRDRAGEPRCGKCPDIDGRDPITLIHKIIAELDPHADRETIAIAIRGSAPRPAYQQKLAWALETHPALLTGDGHLAPLRAIPRLIDLLHGAGVAGIVRPICPGCHRVVRIDKPLNGMRVCRMCIAHSRIEKCSRCGARREPATRDPQGRPLCPNCLITDPDNLETCINCGRRRAVCTRTPEGPLCGSCPTLLPATCSVCGQETPCGTSRITGLPWCPGCQRRLAACSACGRDAAIVSGTADRPLCADCTTPPTWISCPVCSDPDHPRPGQCARCLIDKRLDEVMGPAVGLVPGLQALRRNIATTEHHITAMRWLTKKSVAPVLSDLAGGRTPLTHEALDELSDSPALAHLRQTLVSVGALPERDEEMARLEQFLTEFIASQQDSDRRKVLHRYVVWNLVRRLRDRNNGRRTSRQQSLRVRSHARAAVAFLDWLDRHERTLDSCRQADLDQWLTDDTGAYRYETGTFIRWAHANKLTTVYISAKRWNGPTDPLDEQHRWNTARRLRHDDTLKAEDRLAGLLLLLYAQGPSTISRLTVEHLHIDDRGALIYLGRAPIHLPEPVAELARTTVANRKGHATIGALTPSPWLFPGGQPGRPISTDRLTLKLNRLGISPNQARSTALFQLATEIPAAILARTLGINTDAAVRWQRLSAGDWATYAAEVSRRTTESDRHSDSLNI